MLTRMRVLNSRSVSVTLCLYSSQLFRVTPFTVPAHTAHRPHLLLSFPLLCLADGPPCLFLLPGPSHTFTTVFLWPECLASGVHGVAHSPPQVFVQKPPFQGFVHHYVKMQQLTKIKEGDSLLLHYLFSIILTPIGHTL